MGAMAPTPPWNPKDDLLLKNSVEAGASLKSLAKGAVQFSRRFTVQELRERWHSLLYDPVVSDEASSWITEFEHYAATPAKSNRFGNSKDNKIVPAKRKFESVRKRYRAMRNRICEEPFNPMDLSILIATSNSNFGEDGDGLLPVNGILENSITNPFGPEESTLGIMHNGFPEILSVGGTDIEDAATYIFHTEPQTPAEENFHMERQNAHEEIIGANMSLSESCSGLEELGQQPKDQLMHCLFETDGQGTDLDSTLDNYVLNEFGEKQLSNSLIKDCSASFHNLGYSSPLPGMEIWQEDDDISGSGLPVDVDVGDRDEDLQIEDIFTLPDDGGLMDISKLGNMDNQEPFNELKVDDSLMDTSKLGDMDNQKPLNELQMDDTSTEGYLAELSNTLMDFTDDDEILLMEDGKDMIGKFFKDGLGSLLLHSTADDSQCQVLSLSEPETSVHLDTYLMNPTSACHGKLWNNNEPQYGVGHRVEAEMPSPSLASNPQLPELLDGIICCTLNTEDPEIPCNDDVIFHKPLPLSAVAHAAKQSSSGIGNQSSSGNRTPDERVLGHLQREDESHRHASSQGVESQVLPQMRRNQSVGDCQVESGFPYNDTQCMVSTRAGFAGGCPSQIKARNDAFTSVTTKEETTDITMAKHHGHYSNGCLTEKQSHGHYSNGCLTEKPSHGSDSLRNSPTQQEPSTIQNHQGVHVEDFTPSEPVADSSTSDQHELAVESDDDLPYFSDVEAMILEMDLDPDDLDLHSNEEVSKYQHEDSLRAITRLEQGFRACMRREIASHGAFAVLIGHQTKHYIRKPEVVLGRSTEDVAVDIDLGREVCANKISRRQAIIEMDNGGSFFLKNLGKHPISLNDKEIAYGQSLSIFSSCLIEIRGVAFTFEINQSNVKRFLDSQQE